MSHLVQQANDTRLSLLSRSAFDEEERPRRHVPSALRPHCPSCPTYVLQSGRAKGSFCPSLWIQHFLRVHYPILSNCNLWVKGRLGKQGLSGRHSVSDLAGERWLYLPTNRPFVPST